MKQVPSESRRRFLKTLSVAAVAVPFAGVMIREVRAQDMKPLDNTNPTAAALGYVESSASVDAAKYPQHKAEQDCANCQFFTGGAERGGCQLFPGFSVAAAGWCASWSAKPA